MSGTASLWETNVCAEAGVGVNLERNIETGQTHQRRVDSPPTNMGRRGLGTQESTIRINAAHIQRCMPLLQLGVHEKAILHF